MDNVWHWLKEHDLPNSFVLLFSLMVWPLALLVWHRWKRNIVSDLEVSFTEGQININEVPHNAVAIDRICNLREWG